MTEPYDRETYLNHLIEREEKRRQKFSAPKRHPLKKYWIYYRDSGRWVQASETGFNFAIKHGRPVARSQMKPRKVPMLQSNEILPTDYFEGEV